MVITWITVAFLFAGFLLLSGVILIAVMAAEDRSKAAFDLLRGFYRLALAALVLAYELIKSTSRKGRDDSSGGR